MDDIWKSGLGAFIGFILAQIVNFAKIAYEQYKKPKLAFRYVENSTLLSHSEQTPNGDYVKAEYYGFIVKNNGLTIANDTKCFLIKMEGFDKHQDKFIDLINSCSMLKTFNGSNHPRGGAQTAILFPNSEIEFLFAMTDESIDYICPAVEYIPEYFEETCAGISVYRFTIGIIADATDSVSDVFIIKKPTKKPASQRAF